LSIHAVSEEIRREIFGVSTELGLILKELEEFLKTASSSRRKKIQLGYLLIKGVNDSEEELEKLAQIAKRYRLPVMLMAYNKVENSPFLPLSEREYEEAFLKLRSFGIRTTLSNRFRRDPLGGCGTLTIAREVAGNG
jgi:23S rRNA (adenine2503-C2)-methyltransferase